MNPKDAISEVDVAWAEPALRERLLRDPLGVLKEKGVKIPDGLPLSIVHEVIRIVSLLWFNGKVIPKESFFIDPSDEGLLFGRGVWESTRTIHGVPWLWPLHIERLCHTAKLLDIDLSSHQLPDTQQVHDFVRSLTSMEVIIRLNLTAGSRGKPGIVWMTAALPPTPSDSIRLQSCLNPVPKDQPYLMWKTFQYATRLRVGQQAAKAGFDSALLVDADKNILEAAHANIFLRLQDGWVTPTLDGGLLPGTVRQHLLRNAPLPIREQVVPYGLLGETWEGFLTNSNVGIVPITQIDDHKFPIGKETAELMRWLKLGK